MTTCVAIEELIKAADATELLGSGKIDLLVHRKCAE